MVALKKIKLKFRIVLIILSLVAGHLRVDMASQSHMKGQRSTELDYPWRRSVTQHRAAIPPKGNSICVPADLPRKSSSAHPNDYILEGLKTGTSVSSSSSFIVIWECSCCGWHFTLSPQGCGTTEICRNLERQREGNKEITLKFKALYFSRWPGVLLFRARSSDRGENSAMAV